MKNPGYLIILFVLIGIGCRPAFKVQSDQMTRKDLSKYTSFKFYNPDNMPAANFAFSVENKKRIFDATANEMKRRGYTSHQEADLIIKIQGGTSKDVESSSRPRYYDYTGYNSYYMNPYYGYRDPWLYEDISKKSTTIIIDILDTETKKLLWQGVGTGVLGDKKSDVETMLFKAISDIFVEYPVPPQ